MSTSIGDPYGSYERAFNVDMLQTEVFGAFFSAVEFRKQSIQRSNVELADRMGTTRSQVSKLLNAPQNWTLKTIAELATALDVDFKFVLVDRTERMRCFGPGGISFDLQKFNTRPRRLPRAVSYMQQEGSAQISQMQIEQMRIEIRQGSLESSFLQAAQPGLFEEGLTS